MPFRSASAVVGISATSGVCPKPAGVVSGDLLVAIVDSDGLNAAASTGWNTPNTVTQNITFDNENFQIITKTAGGSEPSSYTFTNVGLGSICILAFSGYTGAALVVGTPGVSNAGNTILFTATAPAITIPGTGTYDLFAAAGLDQNTDEVWTVLQPSGMTARVNGSPAGEFSGIAAATTDGVASGSTGSKAWGFSAGTGASGWAAVLIAIPATASTPNLTASDAVTVGDSTTTQATFNTTATDAVTVGDSGTAQAVYAAAATDAVTVGDSAANSLVNSRSASDAVTVGDSATTQTAVAAAATDAVTVGDSATTQVIYNVSATDGVTVGDSATQITPGTNVDATDAVTVGDSATTQAIYNVSATDGITVGDSATTQATMAAAATDAVAVGDSGLSGGIFSATASDGVTVGDSATSAQVISTPGASGITRLDLIRIYTEQFAQAKQRRQAEQTEPAKLPTPQGAVAKRATGPKRAVAGAIKALQTVQTAAAAAIGTVKAVMAPQNEPTVAEQVAAVKRRAPPLPSPAQLAAENTAEQDRKRRNAEDEAAFLFVANFYGD